MAFFDRELIGRIVRLAFPVVLLNLLQHTVLVADTIMIAMSPAGAIGNAALGVALPITFLVVTMIMAVTAGAMSLVGQRVGAREPAQAAHVAKQSLALSFGLGLVLSLLGVLAAPWAAGLINSGGDPEVTRLAGVYLQTLFAGGIPLFGTFAVSSIMLGSGDGTTPLKIHAAMNAANVVLSAFLIFGLGPFPELGVQGAALASVLARALGLTLGLWLLWRGTGQLSLRAGGSWLPEALTSGRILRIGLPAALQPFLALGSFSVSLAIVTSTAAGSIGAAAVNIGMTIDGVGVTAAFGTLVAANSLVAQALGAWQPREARRRVAGIALLTGGLMSVIALAMVLAAPLLVDLFIRPGQDPDQVAALHALTVTYLRIIALGLPFLGVSLTLTGALRGAGDTFRPMILTGISRWLVTVPLGWLLAIPAGWEAPGVFWAITLGQVVQCLGMIWLLRDPDWHLVALRSQDAGRIFRALDPQDRGLFLALREELMAPPGARESVTGASASYRYAGQVLTLTVRGGRIAVESPGGELALNPERIGALVAAFARSTPGEPPSSTATPTIG